MRIESNRSLQLAFLTGPLAMQEWQEGTVGGGATVAHQFIQGVTRGG
jgi:hypothetical protein